MTTKGFETVTEAARAEVTAEGRAHALMDKQFGLGLPEARAFLRTNIVGKRIYDCAIQVIADLAGPAAPTSAAPEDRLWIAFVDAVSGRHIRKWDRRPFDGATEYVAAPSHAKDDAGYTMDAAEHSIMADALKASTRPVAKDDAVEAVAQFVSQARRMNPFVVAPDQIEPVDRRIAAEIIAAIEAMRAAHLTAQGKGGGK